MMALGRCSSQEAPRPWSAACASAGFAGLLPGVVLQADHTLARSGERLGRDHVGRQDLSIHEPDRGCRPNDGLGIFRADRRVDSGDLDNLQVVLGDEGPCRNRVSDCEDGLPIWVTSASEGQPRHVNAVVIDTATDPDAVEKVRSLTRCCSVLVTKGTDLDGLPIQGAPLDESDIAGLVTATETHQEVIAAAVAEHKRRTPSSSLKAPTFPTTPNPADHVPVEDTASGRAFAAANYLAAAWTAWP